MLEPPRLGHVLTNRRLWVETAATDSLQDVVARCDWVIADLNSNAHLAALRLGVPTVVVEGLGSQPEGRSDLFGFMEAGVVPPPLATIRDFRPESLIAFYGNDWPARLGRYDAAYLRAPEEVGHEVREAIRRAVDPRTGTVHA
jgi:hypothetical protein